MSDDYILTRAELERIKQMRQQKWAMIQQALPRVALDVKALGKPHLYQYEEEGQHGMKKKCQRIISGEGTRIIYCKIGEEVIVGR